MRFLSVVLGLLCLPLLALAVLLAPVWVPALVFFAMFVPGLMAFKRTSSRRTWNVASYHSPHSLTWRWLIAISIGSMFSRPRIFMEPRNSFMGDRNPFVGFGFNIGIGGAHAYTNNYGWQVVIWFLGVHVHFSQQRPMWYRNLYQRARDEADQLKGHLWVRGDHPHKVFVPPKANTLSPAAIQ